MLETCIFIIATGIANKLIRDFDAAVVIPNALAATEGKGDTAGRIKVLTEISCE